jgi:hypothetical protein
MFMNEPSPRAMAATTSLKPVIGAAAFILL